MTIIEVDLGESSTLEVVQSPVGSLQNPAGIAYLVKVNGEIRHPNCSAEDVMRALGQYLHNVSFELRKAKDPNLFF